MLLFADILHFQPQKDRALFHQRDSNQQEGPDDASKHSKWGPNKTLQATAATPRS